MTTPTTVRTAPHRLSLRNRLRRERYLLALSLWMDDDLPAGTRRSVITQLRGDIDAAAADSSMAEALRNLGPARLLAAEYRDLLDPGRPRWALGSAVAAAWLLLCSLVLLVFASALWQVAPDTGGTVTARLLWAEITVVRDDGEMSLASSGVPVGWIVALVLFLGVARAWRVVPALRRDGARADVATGT